MIDFHCHIDLYPQPSAVLDRVAREGIYLLAVTTTPLAWHGTNALTADRPRVRVGLGLHPELVAERHAEVDLLCSLIPRTKYVGEIGLDGSPDHKASLSLQSRVLDRILAECADQDGRIMTLHSRGAATLLLDALEAHPRAGTAVLHWFSGTMRELERAARLGCWFSVGPAMLRGRKGANLAAAMPRDRVLTETDGPFAQKADRPLAPWDVADALRQLGEIWRQSPDDVDRQIHSNLNRLVGRRST